MFIKQVCADMNCNKCQIWLPNDITDFKNHNNFRMYISVLKYSFYYNYTILLHFQHATVTKKWQVQFLTVIHKYVFFNQSMTSNNHIKIHTLVTYFEKTLIM